MQKPQKYDWKDSNLALFGSKTEKDVKKAASEVETAWQPVKECTSDELFVWRIEKFKVKAWPKEDYGKFFSGDSYIVLNVYKDPDGDELLYDVHFWIGKHSTQDEYGTAAYKTVELDTFLDDKAVQHREVQEHESSMFKSYFKTITYLKGGCATGFRQVKPEEYKPRLLHFCGVRRNIEVKEVKLTRKALNSNDVFILDLGRTAYQWNGKTCNKDERIKAAAFLQQLENERHGKTQTFTLDENSIGSEHKFYQSLPDVPYAKKSSEVKSDVRSGKKAMFRLSDESGKLQYSLVSEGNCPRSMINEDDVYIIDTGVEIFVYVGARASDAEKMNALQYAHDYLKTTQHPLIPVTACRGNMKNPQMEKVLD
ncbi:hypothetical protein BOX15_Mlig019412g3 [Macrostomum lignano]|uniref:Uncharacterized protein n=2 Tax=Macrostomum lignano TaxID=282301 RepID=A0A267DN73_9PLAT|nr:hypothetical protein BOX15_Mlig019412g4 [Macrostomum lignano]PAA59633.1 hypothetical protein BOX15_Mlig019412g3 [Macrostomum lignano]